MEESRREKSAKNLIYAWLNQGVMLLMSIGVRMVFVRVLSKEYLGLSGLFGNIISLLSLAELGIGTAIIYSLYEPLAMYNQDKISSLMKFFQKVYRVVGIAILVIGIGLTPFLSFFIKEMPDIPEIYQVYILFVINAAVSYFFSYKGSLISADQKDYIIKKVKLVVTFCMYLLQAIVLFKTGNYLLFLGIQITSTLVQNVIYTAVANRMYPFLNEKKVAALDPDTLHGILTNTKALLLHKVGDVVKFSTDNLIISKYVGLIEGGIYSNYTLIQQALMGVLAQIFVSMTASVGNLGVTGNTFTKYQIFRKIFFLNAWIYGLCSILFLCLAQDFIGIFFGGSFVMDNKILFMIILNFYLLGMRKTTLTFRDAFGLFWQNRYMPIAEAGINLVISLVLVTKYGITGVLVGTALSTLLLPWWVEPYVVFRHGFKTSLVEYWKQYWSYTIVTSAAVVITWRVCKIIPWERSLGLLVIKALICLAIPNAFYMLLYRKKEEYKYFKEFMLKMKGEIMKNRRLHAAIDWLAAGMIIVSLCLLYVRMNVYVKYTVIAPVVALLLLILFFFNHVNWIEKLKKKDIDLILLILGIVIAGVNLVLSDSSYGAIFNITVFLVILYLSDKLRLHRNIYYAIGGACFILLGIWIFSSDQTYNTNTASMILFTLSAFGLTALTAFLDKYQKAVWGKWISFFVIVGVILPWVVKLRSRGVMAGIAVFVILNYLMPLAAWSCKKLYRFCVVLLIVGSIAFPLLYVWVWKSGINISILTFGKNFFSGRNIVWDQFLNAFYKEPFTGIGSNFIMKIPDLQFTEVHNGLLHIMVVHGIFVFAIAVFLLGKRLFQIGRKAVMSQVTRQCISVIIAIAVVSVFENDFVLVFYNVLVLLLFNLGIMDQDKAT